MPPAVPQVSSRRPRVGTAVAMLSLGAFMSTLDLFIVNLAFPYIGRSYPGSALGSLSWVLNGYTILFAAVLVPAGRWADRVGHKRLFLVGLATFGGGSLACGIAPGVGLLVAARLLQAVGGGLMVPTSLSLLLDVVPPERRARAIGSWSAIGAMGAAVGPVVGGLLVQASWRLVFWVNVPVAILAVVVSARSLPEHRDPAPGHRPDLLGAGLLASGVALAALGLVEAPGWGWGSPRTLGLFGLAAAALAGMLARSARHLAPVVELSLLRLPSFSGSFAASLLYSAGFGAYLLNNVELLTGEWHYSAVEAGLALAPGPLLVLPFARLVAPWLGSRLGGPGRVAALGCLVNGAGQLLWLHELQARSAYATHLLPVQLLSGMGVGLTLPSLLAAGTANLPRERFGTGSGILNLARQVGTALGVAALVGVLAGRSVTDPLASYRQAIVLVTAFYLTSAAVALLLLGRARAVSPDPRAELAGRTAPAGRARARSRPTEA